MALWAGGGNGSPGSSGQVVGVAAYMAILRRRVGVDAPRQGG
jgi:hypothetical protein